MTDERPSQARQYGVFVIFMLVAAGIGLLALSLLNEVGRGRPTTWLVDYEVRVRPNPTADPTNLSVRAWPHATKRGMDQSVRTIPRGTDLTVQREALGPAADTVAMVAYKGSMLWLPKSELLHR